MIGNRKIWDIIIVYVPIQINLNMFEFILLAHLKRI